VFNGEFNAMINSNTCGISTFDQTRSVKIIGGRVAEKKEFPWQISLQLLNLGTEKHICGGSLISESWIITAAHCVDR